MRLIKLESDNLDQIAVALCNFQGEIGEVPKGTEVIFGKDKNGKDKKYYFTKLPHLMAFIKPFLHKNGLSIFQTTVRSRPNTVTIKTTLLHVSGQFVSGILEIPLILARTAYGKPADVNIYQEIGKVISYGRRYGVMAITGLSGDDDDDDATSFNDTDTVIGPRSNKAVSVNNVTSMPSSVSNGSVPTIYDKARLEIRELGVPGATVTSALSAYNVTRLTELKETDVESFVNNLTDYVKMTKAAQGA